MTDGQTVTRVRLDKWLWAARFFKTRSLAAEAITRERVRVGGQPARPSRVVRIGDVIAIEKPPFCQTVRVIAVEDHRGSALEAATRFVESAESVAERERVATRLRADRQARLGEMPAGRPDRRARRELKEWRRGAAAPPEADEPPRSSPNRREDC